MAATAVDIGAKSLLDDSDDEKAGEQDANAGVTVKEEASRVRITPHFHYPGATPTREKPRLDRFLLPLPNAQA